MSMANDAGEVRTAATQENGVPKTKSPTAGGMSSAGAEHELPRDCKRLLIVGAGGFGREVFQWARDTWPMHSSRMAGFLSDDPRRLEGFSTGLEILGPIASYEFLPGDYLLLGIGLVQTRRAVAGYLMSRGAQFVTLIHPRAMVADSSQIGQGSIVCPGAVISSSARVGACVLMNYHSSLGHDAQAGDYAVLSPYATLGGGARIDEDVFLGLHASVGPGKSVGARSKVSANSCVLTDTPSDCIVYGVPGRIAPHVDVGCQRP